MTFLHHSSHSIVSHNHHKRKDTKITSKKHILHDFALNTKLKRPPPIASIILQNMKPQIHTETMQRANFIRLLM